MRSRTDTHLHIVARRSGTGGAIVALRGDREAYVGDALMLRARLVQRLDELQRRMATYHLIREDGAAASG